MHQNSVSAFRVKLYELLKTSWISHFMCDASLRNIWDLQIYDTCYCLCISSCYISALIGSSKV